MGTCMSIGLQNVSPTIRDHRSATLFLRTLTTATKRHRDEPPRTSPPLVQYIDRITLLHSTRFWTDTSLTRLIHLTKHNLTQLSLFHLKLVTNATIKNLTQLPHSKLRQLDITGCTHFSWQLFKTPLFGIVDSDHESTSRGR